jgi:DNA-binding NtrC family response regulator
MVYKGKAMEKVFEEVKQVAETDAPVMILGESGVGKELVARAIHENSKRKDKPFVGISLVAIPDTLIEAEIFGHEKGAFSDAKERRIGYFEQAADGTLFLDEIAEFDFKLQSKLLRVLQEREFQRLGGNNTIPLKARIISATNQDLKQMIKEKTFREDLYHRLNVFPIFVPPLRNRKEDIEELAKYFTKRYSQEFNKPVKGISQEAIKLLQEHSWPGNVRELENTIQSILIRTRNEQIEKEDVLQHDINGLSAKLSEDEVITTLIKKHDAAKEGSLLDKLRPLLAKKATELGGNQKEGAKLLGITEQAMIQWIRKG